MKRYGLIFLLIFTFTAQGMLEIDNAVIRLLPPGTPTTSAYFRIKNLGESDRYIVAANSSIADAVELHKQVMSGDLMKMEKQPKVRLLAGQTVTFSPGGLHLMFFGLQKPLQKAQRVDVQLKMQDGELITFTALSAEPGTESHHQ